MLNGAFLDMLGAEMPLLQPKIRRVIHWGDADQKLDFTTKDDVAAVTAAVALDPNTPRWLRFAGDTVSARDLARAMTEVSGQPYGTLRVGSVSGLGLVITLMRRMAPQRDEVFPAWQGIQYTRDMFDGSVQLHPVDNGRYPELTWTSVTEHVAQLVPRAA